MAGVRRRNSVLCWPFMAKARVRDEEGGDENETRQPNKPRGWKTMPYILVNETAEKISTYGLTANLVIYLTENFNMKPVTANNVLNIFSGTMNFSPVVGAWLSDSYLGRFRTISYASFANLMGMVLITLLSSVPGLKPSTCDTSTADCTGPSTLQRAILYISFAFLTIGSGGVNPCSLPFGVDQFDPTNEQHKKELKSYYNWYYATMAGALFLAYTVIVYIQASVSWPLGFGIPTGLMVIAIIFFFLGMKSYVYVMPEGSIFTSITQVFVASFSKRNLGLPYPDEMEKQDKSLYDPPISHRKFKLRLTKQFRFLNKAAIIREGDLNSNNSPTNKWSLCSIQNIEEVKCLIGIIPVWCSGMIYFILVNQLYNFTYLQGYYMYRNLGPHFTVPAASVTAISYLALTLFIPIYDLVLIPLISKITKIEGGITLLQRQGVGIFLISVANIVAAVVAKKIQNSPISSEGLSPLTAFWLTPQLIILGLSQAFNDIGQIEFYNTQFPEHMLTLATSVFYVTQAGASYLCTLMVNIVNNVTSKNGGTAWLNNDDILWGRLDLFYYVIAIMGVINLLYFLLCAYFYKYKDMKVPQESVLSETTIDNIQYSFFVYYFVF